MALTTKRLTRGPRKGQVIRGYLGKGGKFTEYRPGAKRRKGDKVVAQKTNTQKGNARAGQTYEVVRDRKGRKIHRYRQGNRVTDVVVKPKAKPKAETKRKAKPRRKARRKTR